MPGQRRPQPGARHRAPRSPCSPRSLGKRSAPGGMQPRRFQWQRFIHRRATPPFFNGNGSSIAVRTRPFSMAPAHPSPCEPRVRALPLPGLRGDLVAWVSAAHPGGCNPAVFDGNGSSIAVQPRPFSMAPAHPSPCEPRVRALPLPGLRDGGGRKKTPALWGAGVLHGLPRQGGVGLALRRCY